MLIRNRTIHVLPFENFCAFLEMFVICNKMCVNILQIKVRHIELSIT